MANLTDDRIIVVFGGSMPRTTRRLRLPKSGTALLAAVALSSIAACSSAPAPSALEQGGGAADGGAASSAPGSTVPGAGSTAPGSVTAGSPGAGGPVAGTTTKNADGTVTTVTKDGRTTTTRNGKPVGTTTTRTGTASGAVSTLFTAAEDKIGITDTQINMCAHAALTYGPAFNTTDKDFNVFWEAINTEKGGVFGRRVNVTYENDDYKAETALTAARACNAKGIFLLLGGIGFDQIPAVRNYAEDNHIFYMHHTATINGTKGQKYSFSELPTVERTGEAFAQLAMSKYKGKKIGIIKRDGLNWEPGVVAFKALAKQAGLKIVAEKKVAANKGNYTDEILAMKNAGAEVVWAWENALISTQIIVQAKRQAYSPNWLMFPFNLTSQTLEGDALSPRLDGVAMFSPYSKGDYGNGFQSYADDIKLFEAQYAKYKPNADLNGVGGDLLFLNWQAQKALYQQLLDCGKDCTRNKFVDVLLAYNKRPSSSSCKIDFTTGDRRHGAQELNFSETYVSPSGKVNWRPAKLCVGPAA